MAKPRFQAPVIIPVAKTTLGNARAHVAELSDYGVNAGMLDSFESQIQTVDALPGNAVQQLIVKNSTKAKRSVLHSCYYWGRGVRLRMVWAYGRRSPEVETFPTAQLHKAKESEVKMMPVMEMIIQLATDHHEQLAAFGQTDAIRDQGPELLNQLKQADQVQELKKDGKLSATQERYKQLENIYNLVNNINMVGQFVFANDPAKRRLFESKWPR